MSSLFTQEFTQNNFAFKWRKEKRDKLSGDYKVYIANKKRMIDIAWSVAHSDRMVHSTSCVKASRSHNRFRPPPQLMVVDKVSEEIVGRCVVRASER